MKVTSRPPGPVPEDALAYFRAKRLAPELDMVEVWGEEHDVAFTVAGLAAEDLLAELRRAVDQALAEGVPYETFRKGLDDVLVALGWSAAPGEKPRRLRTIYDANLRTARAAGQWRRIERTASEGRSYLEYSLGPAAQHRPEHVAWDGTVLRHDSSWWATHFPPNGFGCKCRVRQLSDTEAEARGVSPAAPAGAPDPGWDRNFGAGPRP